MARLALETPSRRAAPPHASPTLSSATAAANAADTFPKLANEVFGTGWYEGGRTFPESDLYSARNAVTGSTSAALSAGTTHARQAIEPSASVVTANVAVSCGRTP
jgi:hypothetical protein